MTWLKQIIEFFYKNNQVMWDNVYIFVTWTILCIGLMLAINVWGNRRLKRKYEDIKSEKEQLQSEYNELKKKYSQMDEHSRLLMGTGEFPKTSAKAVSKQIKKKYKNKGKE